MGDIPDIQIISAPSILGLKPTGVEKLAETLLANGLREKLYIKIPQIIVPTLNSHYKFDRDVETGCLNAANIRAFSEDLMKEISNTLHQNHFPLVLGGDCSILIGILPSLKARGNFGLLFCDAHADFYQPEKSITGEVADMDLAIVTGRGPELLTNIDRLMPYVAEQHVIHIGQRDWEETKKYGSQDIRQTDIHCLDYKSIKKAGISATAQKIIQQMNAMKVESFWIHFDTDALADDENPAVDYRIPEGLSFKHCEQLLKKLLSTKKIIGMSVSIFNPALDDGNGTVARMLTQLISNSFNKKG
ncbi:MAG: arginase family protein [Chitinophagaceae bacterium]|nr:arginase family protein [Chitinophagaceae bacterium]